MRGEDSELIPNDWVELVGFLELLIGQNLLPKHLERDIDIWVASPKKTSLWSYQ